MQDWVSRLRSNVSIVTRLFSVYTLYWRNNQIYTIIILAGASAQGNYTEPLNGNRLFITTISYVLCVRKYLCNVRPGQASQDLYGNSVISVIVRSKMVWDIQGCRPWAGGANPDFGSSVNPISTRGDRLGTPGFSDLPTALIS